MNRRFFRSHFFPHVGFVGILALTAIFGIVRQRRHLRQVQQTRTRIRHAKTAIKHCQEIKTLLARCTVYLAEPRMREIRRSYKEVSRVIRLAEADLDALSAGALGRQITVLDRNLRVFLASSPSDAELRDEAGQKLDLLKALVARARETAEGNLETLAETLLAADAKFSREATLALVVLVLLCVAYLYAVNWQLAKPIRNLAQTARTVTEGTLSARANVAADGPVAQLAGDFNEMVDILVASLAEEERVVHELKKKTKQLQEANEHKSRFLANVSHELKTPLSAIIGFADILLARQHGELSQRQGDYLQRIFGAGNHLLLMISDLLDLAKIDVGAMTLNPAAHAPAKLTGEVIEMLMPQIKAKKHVVIFKPPAALPMLNMDPNRFKQVVLNLLSNAIKFTPDKGRIELAIHRRDDGLELSVKDNGIGISKQDQTRIFEDFVQLDSKLHRQHEGTGIGLALTRRLIELMGGTLRVESKPNKGSAFFIHFPLEKPEELRTDEQENSEPMNKKLRTDEQENSEPMNKKLRTDEQETQNR